MVIIVDKTRKDDPTIFCRWGWSPQGRDATISAEFVHGECYNIVAAPSVDEYVATCVVPGSVDGLTLLFKM